MTGYLKTLSKNITPLNFVGAAFYFIPNGGYFLIGSGAMKMTSESYSQIQHGYQYATYASISTKVACLMSLSIFNRVENKALEFLGIDSSKNDKLSTHDRNEIFDSFTTMTSALISVTEYISSSFFVTASSFVHDNIPDDYKVDVLGALGDAVMHAQE